MTEALVVSNLVLWVLVIALALVVAALTRQIGVLHERVAPAGALAVERGPKVGEPAPQLSAPSLAGAAVSLGPASSGDPSARTLLFFLSPSCPVCKTLLPTLKRLAAEEGESLRVVYASDGGSRDEHAAFADAQGIARERYLLSQELGLRFEVSKLPHAVLMDANGVVRAKGMVNTREHLESLFEAELLGVASLQEYAARQASLEVVNGGAKR